MNNGNQFSVRDVIKTGWHNIKGTKWAIWAPQLTALLIYLGVGVVFGLFAVFAKIFPEHGAGFPIGFFLAIIIFEVIVIFLVSPLAAGMQMVALKRHRGESVSASDGFKYWHKWLPLGFTVLLFMIGYAIMTQVLNFLVGLTVAAHMPILTIILGVILLIAILLYVPFFMFNVLCVADKNKGPWQALGCSAKIVAPHWFRTLLVLLWFVVVSIIMSLPAVLGLLCPVDWVKVLGVVVTLVFVIWAFPYLNLMIARTYQKLSESKNT